MSTVRLNKLLKLLHKLQAMKVLIVRKVNSPISDLKVTVSITLWRRLAVLRPCALKMTANSVSISEMTSVALRVCAFTVLGLVLTSRPMLRMTFPSRRVTQGSMLIR